MKAAFENEAIPNLQDRVRHQPRANANSAEPAARETSTADRKADVDASAKTPATVEPDATESPAAVEPAPSINRPTASPTQ